MNCTAYEALLEKWVLGETTEEELEAMEAHEASCPACAQLRVGLESTGEVLPSMKADVPPMPAEVRFSWMHQVEEESSMMQEKKKAPRGRFSVGRRIAIAATLVFVVTGAMRARNMDLTNDWAPTARNTSYQSTGAETGAIAPREDAGYYAADYAAESEMMLGAAPGATAKSASTVDNPVAETKKIIRTVKIALSTTTYEESLAAVKALGNSFGGWIESLSENSQSSRTRYAYVTLRIPADKLDEFLGQAVTHGRVTSREETAEDITARYQDNQGRLTTQRALMDRLRSLVAGAASLSEVLELERTIADTQYAIDSLEASLRHDDSQVDYATVSVTVSEEKVPDQMEVKEYTFLQRMEGALVTGLEGFLGFLKESVLFVIAGLPYLVLALIFWAVFLGVRRAYRKRHPRQTIPAEAPKPAEDHPQADEPQQTDA